MIFAVVTLILLTTTDGQCNVGTDTDPVIVQFNDALWSCFSVQIATFLLLTLHYIKCGCLIRKLGMSMGIFYFGMVGSMVYAQVVFFAATDCRSSNFFRYYWLGTNIALFYVFVAYGISLWGAYICWAQEEEENIAKEAMEWKFKKMVATQ